MDLLQFFERSRELYKGNTRAQLYVKSRQFEWYEHFGYCDHDLYTRALESEYLLTRKVVTRYKANSLYDRLILPIYSTYGKLIALSGRRLTEESTPKYYNSVYAKKRQLFGLYESKQAILDYGFVFVVEGYYDYLRLRQHDLPAVAVLSTTLTVEQICLLSRYTDSIYLCLDSDSAGERSVKKILDKFSCLSNITLQKVALPLGLDPDEYLLSNDLDSFLELLPKELSLGSIHDGQLDTLQVLQ